MRAARSTAASGARSRSPRSTPRPRKGRPGSSPASSAKASAGAAGPRARSCRASDCRRSLVEPALAFLAARGAQIRFTARARAFEFADDRLAAVAFDEGAVTLGAGEAAVLAVNAPVAQRLVPGLDAPQEFRAIVNAHYRIALADDAPFFVGLIGGTAEWVFRKREVLSVTVSAADRLVDQPADELAPVLWRDVARAYGLGLRDMPPAQIVKERRATFAATPAAAKRRPKQATAWRNLALAGDWTETGLPATIEGAIRSGFAAADLLLAAHRS